MDKNGGTNRNYVLLVVLLTFFISSFTGSSVYVALPNIGTSFEMDAISLTWVSTSFLLSLSMFLVPLGRLADIYGRKKIFLYGILVYVVASFFSGISSSGAFLISFQLLQGLGAAMIFGTGVAILVSAYSGTERGKILGLYVAAIYLGLSFGPFLGGLLISTLGWQSIFFASIPFGIIVVALIFGKVTEEWVESQGENFDFVGSIVYSLTVLVIVYAFSILPDLLGLWLLSSGILGILVFVRWELRQTHPILNIKRFIENSDFAISNLATLIHYCALSSVAFLLSFYLQYIKGFGPQSSGIILAVQPLVQTIFSPFVGRLSDKISPQKIAAFGMVLETVGLFLFSLLNENTPTELVVGNLLFLGFGFALFSSPNANAIVGAIEKKFYGVASGTRETMLNLGMVVGMGITMLILVIFIGRIQISLEQYPLFIKGTNVAFMIFSLLCLTGAFIQLAGSKLMQKILKQN